MQRNRSVLMQAAPVLLAVAIAGYLVGASHPSAGAPVSIRAPLGRTAGVSNPVVLEYPSVSGWQAASGAPARVPGLAVVQPLVLAPAANTAEAGLIAGQLAGGGSSPLPVQFLAELRGVPTAEVVSLLNTQAYRYRGLAPIGFREELTLFAIPATTGATTAIVCYARPSPAASGHMKACERLAGKLTLGLEAQSHVPLTPDAGYAGQIAEVVGRVEELRVALRPAMGSRRAAPAALSALAVRLADGLTEASRSLAVVQPPAPAGWTQVTLSKALLRTGDAYLALAAAARAKRPAAYGTARRGVYEAERNLASALKGYGLLGYE
jgi:hypothetical protein